MKRFDALMLCMCLLIGIAVPTALAAGGEELLMSATGGTTLLPADSGGGPETGAEDGISAETEKPADDLLDTVQLPAPDSGSVTAASLSAAQAPNSAASLRFEDLRAVMEEYNPTIVSMEAQLSALKKSDGTMGDALNTMKQAYRLVKFAAEDAQGFAAENAPGEGQAESDLYRIYSALALALGTNTGLMEAQITSIETQLDSLDSTVDTTGNTVNNGINQMIKGAETLYTGILTLERAADGVERVIATLDRAAAITEKQVTLGMASNYDLETMYYQRAQTRSQLEGLYYQIRTNKITLENFCGMELRGTVALADVTLPTQEQLSAVDYEKNLKAATARNVDVMNAEVSLYAGNGGGTAGIKAVDAAEDSFACSYRLVCLDVPEKARLRQSAQETVEYQQRTFQIAEKKYELGMISHEEYLSAQNTLLSAQDDLHSAELALFTAYRGYVWATEHGIA